MYMVYMYIMLLKIILLYSQFFPIKCYSTVGEIDFIIVGSIFFPMIKGENLSIFLGRLKGLCFFFFFFFFFDTD